MALFFGPAGVGVSLEEAEVADGGLAEVFEGLEAVEGVDAPAGFGGRCRAASRAGPCQPFGAHRGPALGEPELGTVVAVLRSMKARYSAQVTGRLLAGKGAGRP